jgi:hypothetical protein
MADVAAAWTEGAARAVGLPKKESGDNYFSIKAIKAAEKAVGGIKSKDADDVTSQGVRTTRQGLRSGCWSDG